MYAARASVVLLAHSSDGTNPSARAASLPQRRIDAAETKETSVKCPQCGHDGQPMLSGPYDRPDSSRSAFYVCGGCDVIVPGYYEAAAERLATSGGAHLRRGQSRAA